MAAPIGYATLQASPTFVSQRSNDLIARRNRVFRVKIQFRERVWIARRPVPIFRWKRDFYKLKDRIILDLDSFDRYVIEIYLRVRVWGIVNYYIYLSVFRTRAMMLINRSHSKSSSHEYRTQWANKFLPFLFFTTIRILRNQSW